MKRFSPLSVDRLEDRCVPAGVTDLEAVAASQVVVADASTDPTAGTVVIVATNDNTQFVIDVYPNDPNDVPDKPVKPPVSTDPPVEVVPPIDDPFWY